MAMLAHPLLASVKPDGVFGLHNWPDLPAGHLAVRPGGMMASSDRFQICLCGKPSHPALPHQGNDLVAAAAALVPTLQETFLRRREPRGLALISVTDLIATGNDYSIPAEACLRGTVRCLDATSRLQALGWFADRWPGAYFWLGTGGPRARPLHDPAYDFDDTVIPAGIAVWTALAERMLAP